VLQRPQIFTEQSEFWVHVNVPSKAPTPSVMWKTDGSNAGDFQLCQFGQLILRKIIKIVATRFRVFKLQYTKSVSGKSLTQTLPWELTAKKKKKKRIQDKKGRKVKKVKKMRRKGKRKRKGKGDEAPNFTFLATPLARTATKRAKRCGHPQLISKFSACAYVGCCEFCCQQRCRHLQAFVRKDSSQYRVAPLCATRLEVTIS